MKKWALAVLLSIGMIPLYAQQLSATLMLKEPGNMAESYNLQKQGDNWVTKESLPVEIWQTSESIGDDELLTIYIKAHKKVHYHLAFSLATSVPTTQPEFYLPGFWYHQNMRSPESAPSFKTSKSWNFREDRLSTPLTSVYDSEAKQGISVLRLLDAPTDVQMQLTEGEVILPGTTSVGYVGFDGDAAKANLTFGYPYMETPKRYLRKLTLTAPVVTFATLQEGEQKILRWRVHRVKADTYGDFVASMWQYSFDMLHPEPLPTSYSEEWVKQQLCGYFRESYVDKYPLKYNSGLTIYTHDCKPATEVQIGFCGRVLLNAFNQLEYGEAHSDAQLVSMGRSIIDSYLANGFSKAGYFHDFVNFRDGMPNEDEIHSIRQQSEAVYAVLHYLRYERKHGRKHKDWELRVRRLLDNLVALQKSDGHFARKFREDGSDVDASGGSTPSATSTLVMGWKYFGNKSYLEAAKRTIGYVEQNIISKSDYFSSTLDANCEDKEAAIAAVTSTYYLAMVSKGAERQHYIDLCRKAAYFAMTWYYTWDVPFAPGQMLGDVGFHSRGWGNVSVENNHIDVFVFELPHIIKWLAAQTGEERFGKMYEVIRSSLCQLMPTAQHHFGIAKPGYNPEVVQHTTWDYGKNGKGFYNDLFAPGWTVASLWELYSPNRTVDFLK